MIKEIYPYLVLDGRGSEAVEFYKQALEAELLSMTTYGDMDDGTGSMPPDTKNLLINAHLKVGESQLMITDSPPGQAHTPGNQVTISLNISTSEKTKEIFDRLQEEGEVTMPLQQTFWSPAYGQLTDKFGIMWHVNLQATD